MAETLVSVIVPIYNVSKYLRQALDSLAAQDMENAEFICVDDCSTDESPEIIREYMAKDSRFRGVFLEKNSACTKARKEGMAVSKGKYVMFLDGDDYMEPDACRKAYEAIEEKDVDILEFGTNIILDDELMDKLPSLEKLLLPPDETIRKDGSELLEMAYGEKKWATNMWNKIYRREVCLKAYAEVCDDYIQNGEDVYQYFLLTYYSTSFAGVPGIKLYNYCYGRGFYGNKTIGMRKFRQFCDLAKVTRALENFLESHGETEKYGEILGKIDRRFYEGTVYNWLNTLEHNCVAEGFDMMCDAWGPEIIISAISREKWNERADVARAVAASKRMERRPHKIRTIGMYYPWIKIGGVERVMSTLSNMWSKMGYKIVIITDTEPTELDFPMAPGAKRVIISDFRKITSRNYIDRAKTLAKAIVENEIDLVDYNAWVSPMMVWDLMLIKALGAAFNYHMHSVGVFGMQFGDTSLNDRMAAGPLMDSIAALSRVDENLYRVCNPNTYFIGNPLDCDELASRPVSSLEGHTILWCGRFSKEKNPLDAVRMFSDVHDKVSDAKLIMIGSGEEGIVDSVREFVAKSGLENCVSMPGYTSDVEKYYLKADVLISTSAYEGFPMVFLEAASYGLPIVAYSLEYVEMVRQCRSLTSVAQGDYSAMASAVVELLLDDEGRKERGRQMRREIIEFASAGVDEKWKTVFESIETAKIPAPAEDTHRIMVETMLHYYSIGVNKLKNTHGGIMDSSELMNLGNVRKLDTDTDLNTLLRPGTYMFVNNMKDSVIVNAPAPGTYKLVVDQIVTGSTRQTLIAASTLNSYVRLHTRGKWSGWMNTSGIDERRRIYELESLNRLWIVRLERKLRRIARSIIGIFRGKK